jgi:hypothetical protein
MRRVSAEVWALGAELTGTVLEIFVEGQAEAEGDCDSEVGIGEVRARCSIWFGEGVESARGDDVSGAEEAGAEVWATSNELSLILVAEELVDGAL